MIRCSIWDKLKSLTECTGKQIAIFAKLLTHLFLNAGLPISTLKVIMLLYFLRRKNLKYIPYLYFYNRDFICNVSLLGNPI